MHYRTYCESCIPLYERGNPCQRVSHANRRQALQWRHNERDGVSYHQRIDCLHNHLFRRRLKKTSKLRVTGLCEGNSPVTGEFPAQMASNAENLSIWWRHHAYWIRQLHLIRSTGWLYTHKKNWGTTQLSAYFGGGNLKVEIITGTSAERHGVTNHRQVDCIFNNLVKRLPTKKTPKFRTTGHFWGGLPLERTINVERVVRPRLHREERHVGQQMRVHRSKTNVTCRRLQNQPYMYDARWQVIKFLLLNTKIKPTS